MKKSKIFAVFMAIFLICSLLFTFTACAFDSDGDDTDKPGNPENPNPPTTHTHSWATSYSIDEEYHWFACSGCSEIKDKTEHIYTDGVCVCGKEESNPIVQGLQYSLSEDGTYAICNGYNTGAKVDRVVEIDAEYNGVPVKEIAVKAFFREQDIEKVVMPDTIEVIGEQAFEECEGLNEVNISNNTINLGKRAFSFTAIKEITIPQSVQTIGNFAFWECNNLTKATINCPKAYVYTFYDCPNLTNVIFGEKVISIDKNSFYNCANIDTIYVTNSVQTIVGGLGNKISGATVFCESQSKPSGWNTSWVSASANYIIWDCLNNNKDENGYEYVRVNGIKYSLKDGQAGVVIQSKNTSGNIVIPNSLTYKDSQYTVSSIAKSAFEDCGGLTTIALPNGVSIIAQSAFENCTMLESVELSNNLTAIDSYAFNNCTSLKAITLPDSLTKITGTPFKGCSSLVLKATQKTKPSGWSASWYSGCDIYIYDCNNSVIKDGIGYTIKNNEAVVVAAKKSLLNANIEREVNINGTNFLVTEIASKVGDKTSSISSLVIPNSVKSIAENAFKECVNLKTLTINGGDIGGNAFRGCTSLQTLTLNNGIINIGNYAFYQCSSLDAVVIPSTVASIGLRAFSECPGLNSITIPKSVETIGEKAIQGGSAVVYCEVSSKPSKWSNDWLYKANSTIIWDYKNNSLDENGYVIVTVGGVKYGLKNGIAVVKQQSANLSGEIVIASEVEYNSKTFKVTTIGKDAFYDCEKITSIIVPEGVKEIEDEAFSYCSNLVQVSLPDSVTTIGIRTFYYCKSLKNIRLPANIKILTKYMFAGCNAFAEFEVPSTVTTININALGVCGNLISVTIPKSVTTISKEAFYNSKKVILYCEAESKPSGWESDWDLSFGYTGVEKTYFPVVWNYKNNDLANDGYRYIKVDNLRYSLKDGVVTVYEQSIYLTGSIVIPKTITYKGSTYNVNGIVSAAFIYCSQIISVDIQAEIGNITTLAFSGCTDLLQVKLPKSVIEIEKKAFDKVPKGATFNYAGTKAEWATVKKGSDWLSSTNVICSDGKY